MLHLVLEWSKSHSRAVSRDLVNHKRMVIVRNRYQKWKEDNEISNIFNFEVTDVKVRHFTVILMFKKLPRVIGKKAVGWQSLPPSIQIFYNFQTFKLS